MKLITKTSIYYLILSLVLFVAGGILFYYSINKIMDEEINEQLGIEKEILLAYIKEKRELPPPSPLTEGIVSFVPVNNTAKEGFRDTVLLSPLKDEMLPYRQLIFRVKIKEQEYAAIITKPVFEKDDLVDTILNSLGILALVLLVVLFFANRWLSARLWKPFYNTLERLRKYDLNKNDLLQLTLTSTEEFRQLNSEIKKMTEKIQEQYRNLKEFSENASHEIQTPLAIIRNKLELILQSENLPPQEIKMIQEAFETTNRLSKLNQSLLLLAKIENRQFKDEVPLNLNKLIEAKLDYFEEMMQFKNIRVEKNFSNSIQIRMHPMLCDILLSNIIGNAIRHNINGGLIFITITGSSLIVSNSGNPPTLPAEKFFERFSKNSSSSESAGLGLAIVKQVCDTYNYTVEFSFSAGLHILTVHF